VIGKKASVKLSYFKNVQNLIGKTRKLEKAMKPEKTEEKLYHKAGRPNQLPSNGSAQNGRLHR
jgi:hypothetical protein